MKYLIGINYGADSCRTRSCIFVGRALRPDAGLIDRKYLPGRRMCRIFNRRMDGKIKIAVFVPVNTQPFFQSAHFS